MRITQEGGVSVGAYSEWPDEKVDGQAGSLWQDNPRHLSTISSKLMSFERRLRLWRQALRYISWKRSGPGGDRGQAVVGGLRRRWFSHDMFSISRIRRGRPLPMAQTRELAGDCVGVARSCARRQSGGRPTHQRPTRCDFVTFGDGRMRGRSSPEPGWTISRLDEAWPHNGPRGRNSSPDKAVPMLAGIRV
jgi:hypothetical protein